MRKVHNDLKQRTKLLVAAAAWAAALLACDADDPTAERALSGTGPSGVLLPPASSPTTIVQVAARATQPACAAISQQARNQRTPADIIIAVDNSGSMSEEIGFVRERLNAFSQLIVESGVDVRIILISAPHSPPSAARRDEDDDDDRDTGLCIAPPLGSGNCPLDSQLDRYHHVARKVDSHDALELITETFPEWRARLRPDANKIFVVVTDDDADDTALGFSQRVASLPGLLFERWSFAGIYCFRQCREAAAVGRVYDALVQQTHGVAGDLCQQDFAPVFDALARSVVESSGLACAWDIPAPPAGLSFERGQVNVQYSGAVTPPTALLQVASAARCGPGGGWYYDEALNPQRILVCPGTCSALQSDRAATIDVLFGCGTQQAPE
jgi:hypothetical protein